MKKDLDATYKKIELESLRELANKYKNRSDNPLTFLYNSVSYYKSNHCYICGIRLDEEL